MRSLQNVLEQFVKNLRKTLLVKGKWGVGKTFALRQFFLSKNCQVKTFSYVSLSGVATVSDERSLAIAGLELEDGQPPWQKFPRKIAWFAKPASKQIPWVGGVADASFDALLSLLTSRVLKGAIVVLDDIERKDKNLPLGSILGVVSRLTEIRKAKVIVIMNEEELVQTDSTAAETLSDQREKIFDQEFEFRPSVEEALAIIQSNGTPEYVEPIAKKLPINNLRVLQKMVWAEEELSVHLVNTEAPIKSRVLSQVVAIAAMRLRGRKPLRPQDLVNGSDFKLLETFRRKGDISANKPENPFRDDLEALDYSPLPVDPLLLEFLDSGDFDQEKFESLRPGLAALEKEQNLRKQRAAISASIWGKFAPLEPQELDRIEQLLDGDDVGQLSPGDLDFFQRILEAHERSLDRARHELLWAQRASIDGPFSWASIEQSLKTEEAKHAFRARLDAAQDPREPQTFKETLNRSHLSLSLPFLQSTEAGDAEALEQILRSIYDPQLATNLAILLRDAQTPTRHTAESIPLLSRFSEALSSALQKLSDEHAMNNIRVDSIRSRAKLDP
jgi:hypothetical protein